MVCVPVRSAIDSCHVNFKNYTYFLICKLQFRVKNCHSRYLISCMYLIIESMKARKNQASFQNCIQFVVQLQVMAIFYETLCKII